MRESGIDEKMGSGGSVDQKESFKTNGSPSISSVANTNGVDVATWVDPCAAGQVEACAALRASELKPSDVPLEDKWSKRKTYNSIQV